MRSKLFAILLALATICFLWTVTYEQKAQVREAVIWEYTTSGCFDVELNRLGAAGWEMVAVEPQAVSGGNSVGGCEFIYKRPKH